MNGIFAEPFYDALLPPSSSVQCQNVMEPSIYGLRSVHGTVFVQPPGHYQSAKWAANEAER